MTEILNRPEIAGDVLTTYLAGGVYWRICDAIREIDGVVTVTVFGSDDDVARMRADLDPARDVTEDQSIVDAIVALITADAR